MLEIIKSPEHFVRIGEGMAKVTEMPKERITQHELRLLRKVLEFGPRGLGITRMHEDEYLAKLRGGAIVEDGRSLSRYAKSGKWCAA